MNYFDFCLLGHTKWGLFGAVFGHSILSKTREYTKIAW